MTAQLPDPLLQLGCSGDALDTTDNGFDGTVDGPVPAADRFGEPGQALAFDGADDFIALPDEAGQYPASDVTFAAWLRLDAIDGKRNVRLLNINGAASGVTAYNGGLDFRLRVDDGEARLAVYAAVEGRQDNSLAFESTGTLPLGEFVHLAIVREDADFTFFIDGSAAGSFTGFAEPIEYDYEVYDIDVVEIGRFNRGNIDNAGGIDNPENKFDGVIDELALYDQALTAAEIAELATDPTVTFDLDGRATADDPAELTQTVPEGGDATAPAFTVDDFWVFTGWDGPLTGITADRTITAQYAYDTDNDGVRDEADDNRSGITVPDSDALRAYAALDADGPLPPSARFSLAEEGDDLIFGFPEAEDTGGLRSFVEWTRDLAPGSWRRDDVSLAPGPVEDGRRRVEARLLDLAEEPQLFVRLQLGNPAPEADDAAVDSPDQSAASTDLLATANDPLTDDPPFIAAVNGDPDLVGQPIQVAGGLLTIGADGSADFEPAADLPDGAERQATVSYTVGDPFGGRTDASLGLTATGVNDPPVATPPGGLALTEGDSFSLDPASLGSDVDNGDTLGILMLDGESPPTEGNPLELASGGRLIRESDGGLRYEPTPRFGEGAGGTESFT